MQKSIQKNLLTALYPDKGLIEDKPNLEEVTKIINQYFNFLS